MSQTMFQKQVDATAKKIASRRDHMNVFMSEGNREYAWLCVYNAKEDLKALYSASKAQGIEKSVYYASTAYTCFQAMLKERIGA